MKKLFALLFFLPLLAQGAGYPPSGGGGVGSATNVAYQVMTNFVLNTVYTNTSGGPMLISSLARVHTAAVNGDSSIDLMVDQAGGTTFVPFAGIRLGTTVAVTLAMDYTNSVSTTVSNLATYYWTNSSVGVANVGALIAGTASYTALGAVTNFVSAGIGDPNSITNNDTRANILSNKLTVSRSAGFSPLVINDGTGVGWNNFGDSLVTMGNGGYWVGKSQVGTFGSYDTSGKLIWGGHENNDNATVFPYLAGTAGMLTNQMPVNGEMDYMYPVPIFIINSFFDMSANPNGAWATNTIALLKTVFPGWYNTGWSNIWYDDGVLTNRVGVGLHLTNNSAAFPQGITGVVTYAHSQGFNIGTYVAHSQAFCVAPGQPTSDEFIYQDVLDIGAMGFDLLKIDTCGTDTLYQGLPYGPGTASYLTRRHQMFPEANMFMSRRLQRKPLFMLSTETVSQGGLDYRGAWHPHYSLSAFNLTENASPPGGAGIFGGNVTNFVFEGVSFYEHRPGHTHRLTSPNSTVGPTKEYVSLCVLGPSSVQVNLTNVIGSGTLSLYYTNAVINALVTHPLVKGGFEVISNSANKVVTIARPLGPSNGRATTSSSFNGGGFVPGLGLGGYTTFGTDGTNAVGVFNLDSSAHTQVINVNNIGCPSNTVIQVYDMWNNSLLGSFIDQYTTPSIPATDCSLYLFVPTVIFTANVSLLGSSNYVSGSMSIAGGTGSSLGGSNFVTLLVVTNFATVSNLLTIAAQPDFRQVSPLFVTNASFVWATPTGFDTAGNDVNYTTITVSNNSGSAIVMTGPANYNLIGTNSINAGGVNEVRMKRAGNCISNWYSLQDR